MSQLNFKCMLTNLRAQPSVFSDTHIGGCELAFFPQADLAVPQIEKQNSIK